MECSDAEPFTPANAGRSPRVSADASGPAWLRSAFDQNILAALVWVGQSLSVPKIFEKDGYMFFFYSNEHRPIHVHVRRGGGEAVFEVENGVELRESQGLKVKELSKAETLAEEHRELIIQKWHEHLNR
jgi:hypothetical protein